MDPERVSLDILDSEHTENSTAGNCVLEIVYDIDRKRDGAC